MPVVFNTFGQLNLISALNGPRLLQFALNTTFDFRPMCQSKPVPPEIIFSRCPAELCLSKWTGVFIAPLVRAYYGWPSSLGENI